MLQLHSKGTWATVSPQLVAGCTCQQHHSAAGDWLTASVNASVGADASLTRRRESVCQSVRHNGYYRWVGSRWAIINNSPFAALHATGTACYLHQKLSVCVIFRVLCEVVENGYRRTMRLLFYMSSVSDATSEWVSSFLTAHQHIKGHSVP